MRTSNPKSSLLPLVMLLCLSLPSCIMSTNRLDELGSGGSYSVTDAEGCPLNWAPYWGDPDASEEGDLEFVPDVTEEVADVADVMPDRVDASDDLSPDTLDDALPDTVEDLSPDTIEEVLPDTVEDLSPDAVADIP